MKLVIDIPKEMIISLEQGSFGTKYNMYDLVGCVMNGTPLTERPKGKWIEVLDHRDEFGSTWHCEWSGSGEDETSN